MSIVHKTEPAEEGAPVKEPQPFLTRRSEFEERMSKANQQARETALVVQAHLSALRERVDLAYEEATLGHLGICAAYLGIAQRDLAAALAVLPQL
ncbi:MAG TPA: hypothetical protein VGM54_02160 [Chthoniobacter sp.]|jgi:hypothetical protein